jgi:undecaprenyl-diphosphatase
MPAPAASGSPRSSPIVALTVGFAALAVFLLLVPVALAYPVDSFDRTVEYWFWAHTSAALTAFFDIVSKLAGITGMRILGFTSALLLFLFRSRRVGIGMVVVVLAGMQTFEIAKRRIARTRPAHGLALDHTFAFPSGHATLSAAVCCTLAYVLWRERLVPGSVAVGVGIALPVLIGMSRVYLDMHWATDVAGGWMAGLVIASVAAAAYEWTLTRK